MRKGLAAALHLVLIASVSTLGATFPQDDAKKIEELTKRVAELERRLTAVEEELGRGSSPDANENHVIAALSLEAILNAESEFRGDDRDRNRFSDFWTGDVSGLYRYVIDGVQLKLINRGIAEADAAPLKLLQLGALLLEKPKPQSGYLFRAMTRDAYGLAYQQETGTPSIGRVHNMAQFGFCAYPSDYGKTGIRTFIISEGVSIFWKDTGGKFIDTFPVKPLEEGWKKVDVGAADRKKFANLTEAKERAPSELEKLRQELEKKR
jgi:hypothetical protein